MKKLILLGALSVLLCSALGNAAGNGDPEEDMQKAGINLGGKAPAAPAVPAASEREPTEAEIEQAIMQRIAEEERDPGFQQALHADPLFQQMADVTQKRLKEAVYSMEKRGAMLMLSMLFEKKRIPEDQEKGVDTQIAKALIEAIVEGEEGAPEDREGLLEAKITQQQEDGNPFVSGMARELLNREFPKKFLKELTETLNMLEVLEETAAPAAPAALAEEEEAAEGRAGGLNQARMEAYARMKSAETRKDALIAKLIEEQERLGAPASNQLQLDFSAAIREWQEAGEEWEKQAGVN